MEGKAKRKKKKKKGKLTLQVACMYWCILILIFGINGVLVFQFSMGQKILFLKQVALTRATDFADLLEAIVPVDWLMDYWYEHPDNLQLAQASDMEEFIDMYERLDGKYGIGWDYLLTQDDYDAMEPTEQEAASKFFYDLIWYYGTQAGEINREVMEGPILAGGRPGERPMVYFNGSPDYDFAAGETLDIEKGQLEQLGSSSTARLAGSNPDISTIQIAADTGRGRESLMVVGCVISTEGNDLLTYVMMGVDEPFLKKQSMGAILRLIGLDILISFILGFALMQLLYYLILRPVTRIQNGLQDYVETGDTDEVVKTMGSIPVGNEIGRLARDIGNMVQEMEAHVMARQHLMDEQERMAAELENAARIQRAMLPNNFPDRSYDPRLELYAAMAPAREVGGDLYDFFMVDQDRIALVIADVSGKGIPAALFMMEAKTLIREATLPDIPLDRILERVNGRLCAFNEEQEFITTWIMIVDLLTGKALEVNAGHTNPVLCRFHGSYEMVENMHDLPLGIIENLDFSIHEWQLEAGDRIFVYTDGISEADNGSGNRFGTDRLLAALNEKRGVSQKETLAFVSESIHAFLGTEPLTDDMTMLGMTFFGTADGVSPQSDEQDDPG